ncbi:hypothetical protein PM082_006696 [Marasmius tenuissimus]|nr:hypothetical protein PM082_006696 [Marasmius tenuissimus]
MRATFLTILTVVLPTVMAIAVPINRGTGDNDDVLRSIQGDHTDPVESSVKYVTARQLNILNGAVGGILDGGKAGQSEDAGLTVPNSNVNGGVLPIQLPVGGQLAGSGSGRNGGLLTALGGGGLVG